MLLTLFIFAAALLYSSVGHAGASGYLAAMALFGVAPAEMKPTALLLNILVALIASVKFYRAGCFSWPLFWPFALTSIPFAFLGGGMAISRSVYKGLVGVVLLYAALRLVRVANQPAFAVKPQVPLAAGLVLGAAIGLLSGLIGVGGGIFLSPLLLFLRWADTRQASGVAAPFILVNSLAAFLGHLSVMVELPAHVGLWVAAAAVGGWIGAEQGSRQLTNVAMRRLLALVLVIAGLKMIAVG